MAPLLSFRGVSQRTRRRINFVPVFFLLGACVGLLWAVSMSLSGLTVIHAVVCAFSLIFACMAYVFLALILFGAPSKGARR